MGVLSNLEPKNVFYYFEEITKIPHGSGNVKRISDYLAAFAKEHNLFCIQDELYNIIMTKEASEGYEKEPVVILQGHMDMVAVKTPDSDIDLKEEGLCVAYKDDYVYAEGTSLGGDDGIAVAYALALLADDTLKHPKLEVILTVDEEVGMEGATGIDLSMIQGNRLINLDSEDEGIFLTSCAGGARVRCNIPMHYEKAEGTVLTVKIAGLLGGHSGEVIDKGRGNANCLWGRIIREVAKQVETRLVDIEGGLADNAIPREAVGKLLIPADKKELCIEIIRQTEAQIKGELAVKDPGVYVDITVEEGMVLDAASIADTKKAVDFLVLAPNGVMAMSADIEGLVETSLNLGMLSIEEGHLSGVFAVRSSIESAKYALIDRLYALTEGMGGYCKLTGVYPGWQYRSDSPLRDKMVSIYEQMYGVKPRVEAIHAGLECGILGSKIKDLDCVSLGPQMKDIHTTEEMLSISSTRRVWEYLLKVLETKES